jgi:hypothetical protein
MTVSCELYNSSALAAAFSRYFKLSTSQQPLVGCAGQTARRLKQRPTVQTHQQDCKECSQGRSGVSDSDGTEANKRLPCMLRSTMYVLPPTHLLRLRKRKGRLFHDASAARRGKDIGSFYTYYIVLNTPPTLTFPAHWPLYYVNLSWDSFIRSPVLFKPRNSFRVIADYI